MTKSYFRSANTALQVVLCGTFLLSLLIVSGALPLAGQTVPLPAVYNRVGLINETKLVTLPGHVHPLAQAKFDQGVVADSVPVEHLIVVLHRSPEQEAAAAVLVDQLHNRNSAQFHQWLTPEDFGRQFGPSDNDIQKVTSWFRSKGFTIDDVPPGRTHIIISGTAGQVRNAFHTQLHNLSVNGERHIGVLTDPQIPAALAPVVAGFRQLHDWRAKPLYHPAGAFQRDSQTGSWQKVSGPASSPEFTFSYDKSTYYAVGPQDWYTIYNSRPLYAAGTTGAGTTIAVLEETEVVNPEDVDTFRAQFGLPAYPATPTSTQGGVNWVYGPGNGCDAPLRPSQEMGNEESEALLDVEWAGAIAPNATVDFVACASTSSDLGAAGIDLAASYVANYLSSTVVATSLSYGECEIAAGAEGALYYSNLWQQLAAEGITAIVSSGDAGSLGCNQGSAYGSYNPSPNALSSSIYNLSAGGTDFSDYYQTQGYTGWWNSGNGIGYSSALSYVPEVAWGGLCSNPLTVSLLQYAGNTAYGTTYSPLALCNSTQAYLQGWLGVIGGGGGISQYNPIASWQGGVFGIGNTATSTGYRNLPDLSFFAASGWWGHFLLYCQSDLTVVDLSGSVSYPACDYSNSTDAILFGAGGTSFVAPQIAGLMALVNQQTGSRQGVANYTLYNLAATEYGTPGSPNSLW
jgi:subtilase family serine protease